MSNIIDVFRTTTELTERVSNEQLPYNGVLAAVMGIGIYKLGSQADNYDVRCSYYFNR